MSDPIQPTDRPLPEGVRDLLFADAAAWRAMEASLQRTWSAWGYREIILPTFEYADTLATDVGAQIDAEMYRFFDRHGRTLALRPDLTIPTARVVGTRLFDQPMPLRLSYVGNVFRYEPPRAGRQHEFSQAGVELIGARGSAADAEVIALAVAALRGLDLPEFRVTVGHVGFFRGLLAGLGLPERVTSQIRSAVARKSEAELMALLAEAPGPGSAPGSGRGPSTDVQNAALALLRFTGDADMLDAADPFCLNLTMVEALDDLRAVARLLDAYGVADAVGYDLAEVRDLNYYTGVTFEGFAPGLGFSLIAGGRYDGLLGHFGPPRPAVGWALTLDRVLVARELQGIAFPEPRPDAILAARGCRGCLAWAAQARGRGMRIEVDPLGLEPAELWEYAQARNVPRIIRHVHPCEDDPTRCLLRVRDAGGERLIGADDWGEVAAWMNR